MEKITYKLEGFEGPLDLLLTLLSKNKVSIYDVSISELLEQYLAHIRVMQELDMEVASEFFGYGRPAGLSQNGFSAAKA